MTDADRDLLIWLAKYLRDRTSTSDSAVQIQRLIIAAQAPVEPQPIITEYPNCTVKTWPGKGGRQTPTEPAAEPKPSARANLDARKAFCAALKGWNFATKTDAMEALDAAVPFICAAKDADTATVIADNDEKMAEIERLKRSLELYRAGIHTMREREEKMMAERKAMRTEIERLKKIIEGANDIDAAAERSYAIYAPNRCWTGESQSVKDWWLAIVRAVYGLKSEGG